MLKTRVIPILLWNGSHCVQTVRFGRPARVFGSLMDAVRVYERRNVDELILLNIDAKDSGPLIDPIEWVASQLFCPVTYGGGIKTLDDIRDVLKAGADKVSIKKAATPKFIEAAARKFGSQAIVFSLDVSPITPLSAVCESVHLAEDAGAGEVLLTSMARNGTLEGYDLDMIRTAAACCEIPVIAHGGCGKPEHMLEAIRAGAHAVAASTMFLFTETVPRDCSRHLTKHNIQARIT